MVAGLDQILSLSNENTKIIPGHGPGPIQSPDDLRPYRTMLATVRDRVAVMIAQGKTLEEVQAAGPSAEFDELWGNGFINPENFVREIYLDLTR
jgi:glyoxylase-like metal-dependent hydrolase (beta-lactamase superfamily II)